MSNGTRNIIRVNKKYYIKMKRMNIELVYIGYWIGDNIQEVGKKWVSNPLGEGCMRK
jgi:hypothetical protein